MVNTHKATYEKELRRARKEHFSASSAIVKLQEELKASRNSLRVAKTDLESEKHRSSKREEQAFSYKYQLVALEAELTHAQAQTKVVEEERDALRSSLKEEEVARIAAEGRIPLPASMEEDDEFGSPKKRQRRSPIKLCGLDDENKENMTPVQRDREHTEMREKLEREAMRRQRAEEQIDFMKMECQFQCCSCRVAEKTGDKYIHDIVLLHEVDAIKTSLLGLPTPPTSIKDEEMTELDERSMTMEAEQSQQDQESQKLVKFDPDSGTFAVVTTASSLPMAKSAAVPAAEEMMPNAPAPVDIESAETTEATIVHSESAPSAMVPEDAVTVEDENAVEDADEPASMPEAATPLSTHFTNPPIQTPQFRTTSRTMTIPVQFTPIAKPPQTPATISHPTQPLSELSSSPFKDITNMSGAIKPDGTIDREAALEQIRLRRGRARSVAMGHATPRKQMLDGVAGRRDISAPALRYL